MHQRRRIDSTSRSWPTPILAAVTAVSVVAAAAFGGHHILRTQEAGAGPIEAAAATASFAEGHTTLVDDPAIAAQGEGPGARAVKEFHRDEEFSMFAVTWQGDRDVAAFVRAKQPDGSWSQWYDTEKMDVVTAGTNGTELIYVGPTHDVQVSVGNVDLVTGSNLDGGADGGDVAPVDNSILDAAADAARRAPAAPLPYNVGAIKPVADSSEATDERTSVQDLDAVFIDGKAQEGEAIAPAAVTDGMPKVVSRAGWGANEGIRCSSPTYDDGVKALALHHTAGSNDYSPAQAAAQVRGIYQYHAQTLGWCDVGYNVLVDKYGTIYEGRYGGLDKAVQGAHIGGFNANTWGISMIGNYETAQPSAAMLDSVEAIAAWKAKVSGVDPNPNAKVTLTSGGFSGSKYPAGTQVTLPTFFGHADVHFTQCPGRNVIARWPEIRQNTYAKYRAIRTGSGPVDSGSGAPGASASAGNGSSHSGAAAHPNATSSLGNLSLPVSTIEALLTVAAAVAAILFKLGGVDKPAAGVQVAGMDANQVTRIVSKVVSLSGDEGLQGTWTAALNSFGPLLGLAVGGPEAIDANRVIYQLFENGVVISGLDSHGEQTGARALVGDIAKAWSAGGNAAKLGLPLTGEEPTGNGHEVRVQFDGGAIYYDPDTGQVRIETD